MANEKLVEYIKQELAKGFTKEQLVSNLSSSGWGLGDIEEAFNSIYNVSTIENEQERSMQGVTELFKSSWSIYKDRFFTFVGIALLAVVVRIIILLILGGSFLLAFSSAFLDEQTFGPNLFVSALIVFSLGIIAALVQFWSLLSLIYAVKHSDQRIGVIESYRRSLKKVLSSYWINILISFIVLGALVFFIIPGILFLIWFSLAILILVEEDIKGMNALLKSREYLRGYMFDYIIRILFISVVFFFITLIPLVLVSLMDSPLADNVLEYAFEIFLMPLSISYAYLLYKNLKGVKGDFDFRSSLKQKVGYLVVGAMGTLIVLVVILSFVIPFLRNWGGYVVDPSQPSLYHEFEPSTDYLQDYDFNFD